MTSDYRPVYGLYALEIVQTALATGDALQWFAIGFGDMVSLSKPWYSALDAPLFDGVIALVVQLFFCWRIWVCSLNGGSVKNHTQPILSQVLSRSWPLAGTIGLVCQFSTNPIIHANRLQISLAGNICGMVSGIRVSSPLWFFITLSHWIRS